MVIGFIFLAEHFSSDDSIELERKIHTAGKVAFNALYKSAKHSVHFSYESKFAEEEPTNLSPRIKRKNDDEQKIAAF